MQTSPLGRHRVASVFRRLGQQLTIAGVFVLTGCAGYAEHQHGLTLIDEGKYEEGVAQLAAARRQAPDNPQYRMDWLQYKTKLVNQRIQEAQAQIQAYQLEEAGKTLEGIRRMEPTAAKLPALQAQLKRYQQHAAWLEEARKAATANQSELALDALRRILTDNPAHAEAATLQQEVEQRRARWLRNGPNLADLYRKPVSLEFRDADVRMIFEALSKATGINFVLDSTVRPDLRTTVYLKKSSIDDALNLILASTQLERKILNSETVLIYPDTAEKNRQHQDLVIRGFFLENADAKQVATTLQSLLKIKDVTVDERLNAVMVRDTPDAMDVAQKLVAMQDQPQPEVLLDVEVLELKRNKLTELGIQIPKQISLKPLPSNSTNGLTGADLRGLNSSTTGVTMSNVNLNLDDEDGSARLLANPSIRVRNREKANILIGDKLPVITTTTTTNNVSENFQYVDVGLKLDVEPNIYLKDDVAIKIGLEVSSVVNTIKSSTGSIGYQIGTRNASTVLRLHDGETQLLAGLINREERTSANRIPGLGDLPVIGRLFSSTHDETNNTEIVLSITPHIVRNIRQPSADSEQFWIGTEDRLSSTPVRLPEMNATATDTPSKPRQNSAAAMDFPQPPAGNQAAQQASVATTTAQLTAPPSAKPGDIVPVKIGLQSDQPLRSLSLQLVFDSKAFTLVDVVEGDYFQQRGGTTSLSHSVDPATGKVMLGITRAGADGVDGNGSVAELRFRALPGKGGEFKVQSLSPLGNNGRIAGLPLPAPAVVTVAP